MFVYRAELTEDGRTRLLSPRNCALPVLRERCVSSCAHPVTSTKVGSLTHCETHLCVHASACAPSSREREKEREARFEEIEKFPPSLRVLPSLFHRRPIFTLLPLCAFTRARVAQRWLAAADICTHLEQRGEQCVGEEWRTRRFRSGSLKRITRLERASLIGNAFN